MTTPIVTVFEEDGVEHVLELMLRHGYYRIPVVRDGKPVGIIARHDLLRLVLG